MKCRDCCNFVQEHDIYLSCRLTNICLKKDVENVESKCEYFNNNMSEYDICLNCKHYLGGGDWGLSCGKDYYKLVNALDKSCDEIERK